MDVVEQGTSEERLEGDGEGEEQEGGKGQDGSPAAKRQIHGYLGVAHGR